MFRRGDATERLEGFHPWAEFEAAVRRLDPTLRPRAVDPSEPFVLDFLRRFDRCATHEIAVAFDLDGDETEILLDEIEASGRVKERAVGSALFWEPAGK